MAATSCIYIQWLLSDTLAPMKVVVDNGSSESYSYDGYYGRHVCNGSYESQFMMAPMRNSLQWLL